MEGTLREPWCRVGEASPVECGLEEESPLAVLGAVERVEGRAEKASCAALPLALPERSCIGDEDAPGFGRVLHEGCIPDRS